jgi:tRNA threonylcarbamoyladenosine biosynthesis protein TsaE
MKEFLCKSVSEMQTFADSFISGLAPNKKGATVVGLCGNLGSGKTTFTQCVAKTLGVPGSIQSPTFVIQKRYKIQNSRFINLLHIDAYRLDNGGDLKKLGWDDIVSDPRNLILIEWADRVSDILPKNHTKLFFEFIDEKTRKIGVE